MLGQIPHWIASGGPYLLLPADSVNHWSAVAQFEHPRESLPASPLRNYDEACRIAAQHDIGLIELDDFSGIVLGGGDIPMATWLSRPNRIGADIVVALEWGFDYKDVNLAAEVASLDDSAFKSIGVSFRLLNADLVLFAAAESPPPFCFGSLHCPIVPGTYRIASMQCEFGDYLVVRVHRLIATSVARGSGTE